MGKSIYVAQYLHTLPFHSFFAIFMLALVQHIYSLLFIPPSLDQIFYKILMSWIVSNVEGKYNNHEFSNPQLN